MTHTSAPRSRGAPKCNKNALKHGFYGSKFHSVASLPENFPGLQDEITALRLLIRRQAEIAINAPTFQQYTEEAHLFFLSCLALIRLLNVHLLFDTGSDQAARTLAAVFDTGPDQAARTLAAVFDNLALDPPPDPAPGLLH